MRRRKVIAIAGSIGAAVLAGCSGGGEDDTMGTADSGVFGSEDADSDTGTTSATGDASFGPVAWSQRGAGPKRTSAADVSSITTDSPSTTVLGKEFTQPPLLTGNRVVWRKGVFDLSGTKIRELPARTQPDLDIPQLGYSNGTVVIPRTNELVGADPLTGEELWRYATRTRPRRIIVRGDMVYALLPDDPSMIAVDLVSGDRRWRSTPFESLRREPFLAGKYLYPSTRSDGANFAALDFETGETVTTVETFGFQAVAGPSNDLYVRGQRLSPEGEEQRHDNNMFVPLALDNQHVYALSSLGGNVLKALDLEDGSPQWEFELPAGWDRTKDIAVSSERVYVALDGSRGVLALSKADGSRANIYSIPQPTSLTVGEGTLAVTSVFEGEYTDEVGVRLLHSA